MRDEILDTVTDGTLLQGEWEAAGVDTNAAPTLLKSLEYLDLDAPGGASASPVTPQWQDASLDPGLADVKRTAEGLVPTAGTYLWFKNGPKRDGAIGYRMPFTRAGERLKLLARSGGENERALYQGFFQNDGLTPFLQHRSGAGKRFSAPHRWHKPSHPIEEFGLGRGHFF